MRERLKLLVIAGVLAGCVLAAFTVPLPSPARLRDLAADAGPAAPLAMFCGYSVLAALPVPRTVLSLASGLLLGTAVGVVVALLATVTGAVLGYALARTVGHRLLGKHLHFPAARAVDARLAGGGVLAVTSVRLVPFIPFAPVNYLCGLSSVRLRDYVAGTALGSAAGTVAVVILGDALTGHTPPELLACYAVLTVLGAAGLYRTVRRVPVTGDISR